MEGQVFHLYLYTVYENVNTAYVRFCVQQMQHVITFIVPLQCRGQVAMIIKVMYSF